MSTAAQLLCPPAPAPHSTSVHPTIPAEREKSSTGGKKSPFLNIPSAGHHHHSQLSHPSLQQCSQGSQHRQSRAHCALCQTPSSHTPWHPRPVKEPFDILQAPLSWGFGDLTDSGDRAGSVSPQPHGLLLKHPAGSRGVQRVKVRTLLSLPLPAVDPRPSPARIPSTASASAPPQKQLQKSFRQVQARDGNGATRRQETPLPANPQHDKGGLGVSLGKGG